MSTLDTKKLALLGLASLCHAAVDEQLSPEGGVSDILARTPYSCCAVSSAAHLRGASAFDPMAIFVNLQGYGAFSAFSDIPAGPERQYARALWLTMLATAIEAGDMDPADFGLE